MARSPRYHAPGTIYHVMARGNGGQNIVAEPRDYRRLLDVICKVKSTSDFKLYAYCLMPNHFHALIEVGDDPLSHFMHRIQSSWAKRFNLANDRRGHLFQQRFKSKHCADDTYCRWLLRYIHINPVDAGLVQRPEDWPWSSFREYFYDIKAAADVDWPLSLFSGNRSAFRDFVLQDFESPAPEVRMEDSRRTTEIPQKAGSFSPTISFDSLALLAAVENEVEVTELYQAHRGHRIGSARRSLAWKAAAAGYRAADIARRLGLSRAAVSKMMRGSRS